MDRIRGAIQRNAGLDRNDGSDTGQRIFMHPASRAGNTTFIECHIFGRRQIHADTWVLMVNQGLGVPNLPAGANPAAEPAWMASFTAPGTPFHAVRARSPGGHPFRPPLAKPIDDPPGQANASRLVLSKVPKYSEEDD
jgi:hypothetical protein